MYIYLYVKKNKVSHLIQEKVNICDFITFLFIDSWRATQDPPSPPNSANT